MQLILGGSLVLSEGVISLNRVMISVLCTIDLSQRDTRSISCSVLSQVSHILQRRTLLK